MDAIESKYLLNNRRDKHAYSKEATVAAEYLQHIIDDFVGSLFELPKKFTYKSIYLWFLDKWKATIEHMKSLKFKTIVVDAHFFEREFAPAIKNKLLY